MRYVYLNDRTTRIGIHAGSSVNEKYFLEPQELVVVEIPENTVPYIKAWDNMVLLSYSPEEET